MQGAEERRAHCNDGQFSVLLVFNSLFRDSILTPKNSTFSYYLPSMVLFWHFGKMTLAIRDLVTNTIYQYCVIIDFSVSVIVDSYCSKLCHTLPLMLFGIIF